MNIRSLTPNNLLMLFLVVPCLLLLGCSEDEEVATSDTAKTPGDDLVSVPAKSAAPGPSTSEREAPDPELDPVIVSKAELESDEAFKAAYAARVKSGKLKSARIPMRSDGPKSLDPIRGSTTYENQCASQTVETLLQYKYLKRPFEYEPLLLKELPTSEDGLTWHFTLKDDVKFHDNACFPDGKGREVTSADVFYSWKRMADSKGSKSKVWWVFKDTIKGFDEFKATQEAADEFDYDAPVAGLEVVSDKEFRVTLIQRSQGFLWKLCMFQTAVVAREAVEQFGDRFGLSPVGTGPFIVNEGDWQQGQGIKFTRNPNYHESYYPSDHMKSDEADGLHVAAGKRLPLLDEVQVVFYKTDQPMWLQFKAGKLDYAQVPSENFKEAFSKRTKKLTRDMKKQGMKGYPVPLLDFIFRGFNMEDSVIGGDSDKAKYLRQAICLALDWDEQNESFYNGINLVYDGVIPPGLDGYPADGKSPKAYRGPDIERAKALLVKAGYPEGKGLPTIEYFTSRMQNGQEQSEMMAKQLAKIGVNLKVQLLDFSQLIQKLDKKSGQFFSFAWSSDYPEAENNLSLFYGPNESPGANHYNYKNAEYDKLYEKIVSMEASPERSQIFEQMQAILMEDCPYAGAMARTRFFVVTPQMKNFKPVETFENWYKYVDVEK